MLDCIVYVDGASRGNPGPSAIGISLQSVDGQELGFLAKGIGQNTNNRAEYTALVEGLKLAQQYQYKRLEVRSDSQLLVRQMTGEYRIRDSQLRELWKQAQDLCHSFELCKLIHIPRDQNHRADALANKALDER